MDCQNHRCIYNYCYDCLLDKIEIDNLGQCENCIFVSCPNDELQNRKFEELNRILKDDNEAKFEILLKMACIHIMKEELIKYEELGKIFPPFIPSKEFEEKMKQLFDSYKNF